jgi:stage II sporulation protein P
VARPVAVTPERYNQHLSTGSLLLEVGSSGNTLQEALCAVRLFADAAGPALLELAAAEE